MSVWIPHANPTIEEVLACGPVASEIFIKYRTDCVGCPMAAFCTLEEAIELYKLQDTHFRADLEQCLANPAALAGNN